MTTVYYKDKPVWNMRYGGRGMDPEYFHLVKRAFKFLKSALKKVTVDLPYRGPRKYKEGDLTYHFSLGDEHTSRPVGMDLKYFTGYESIIMEMDYDPYIDVIFSQEISGEIIIHKNKDGSPLYPWDL